MIRLTAGHVSCKPSKSLEDSSHFLFQCLKKTNIRARLQDTLNGCKTHIFKYGYLDVRKRIIMNVDFKRLSKLSLIVIKKESNGKIAKIATERNIYGFTLRLG